MHEVADITFDWMCNDPVNARKLVSGVGICQSGVYFLSSATTLEGSMNACRVLRKAAGVLGRICSSYKARAAKKAHTELAQLINCNSSAVNEHHLIFAQSRCDQATSLREILMRRAVSRRSSGQDWARALLLLCSYCR
jgi:hypothetical protein